MLKSNFQQFPFIIDHHFLVTNIDQILQIAMRLTDRLGYNQKDLTYFKNFQNRSIVGQKKNSCAAWNLQGNLLALSCDNSLKIWNFDQHLGMDLQAQSKSRQEVNECKFYNQFLLATINRDAFKLWDVRQQIKPIKTEKKNKPQLIALAWNNDVNLPHFALLAKDNTVSIYDIRNLSQAVCSDKNKNDITELEWDRSGSVLFCAGADSSSSSVPGVLMMYTSGLELISDIICPHSSKINSIAIDPTNQYLVSSSDDSLAAIYSLPDVLCERTYSHTDCSLKKVAFSSKGEYLAVGCEEPKTQLISNKGEQIKVDVQEPCIDLYNVKLGGHAYRIRCGNTQQLLEWHPKKTILAYLDFNQDDRKKPGSEKQERYVHIFSL